MAVKVQEHSANSVHHLCFAIVLMHLSIINLSGAVKATAVKSTKA